MRSSPSSTFEAIAKWVGTALFLLVAWPADSQAHSWMVRHGYTNCAQCHIDPSGSGLLTDYGRAQGEVLLRTALEERSADWEPGAAKDFLWGTVPLPDWMELGGSSRSSVLRSGETNRFIQMQADLRAAIDTGPILAYGTIALAEEGARGALITSQPDMNVVSREHWLGWHANDATMVRVGRMPLPFGLRIDEHTAWVRALTDTDINDAQQHGAAVAINKSGWRAEVMGIVGNLQLSPDDFRERGGSGYFEWMPKHNAAMGVSALYGAAKLDPLTLLPKTRQSVGVFGRWSPVRPIALGVEVDALMNDVDGTANNGHTGLVHVDYEPIQGLHIKGTGEWYQLDTADGTGLWLSALWYFAPHVDLRIDAITRQGTGATDMGLAQLHFYL